MRRYGAWAGCPNGTKEYPERCIAEVFPKGAWRSSQCCRPRGKGPDGLYCGIHANQLAKGRYVRTPDDK